MRVMKKEAGRTHGQSVPVVYKMVQKDMADWVKGIIGYDGQV